MTTLFLKTFYSLKSSSLATSGWKINVFLLVFYFLLNIFLFHSLVGHYGAATHLNFSPQLIVSNFSKYFLKFLCFSQFMAYPHKQIIYGWIESNTGVVLCAAVFSVPFVFYLIKRKKAQAIDTFLLLLFTSYIFAFGATINLYFNFQKKKMEYSNFFFYEPSQRIIVFFPFFIF